MFLDETDWEQVFRDNRHSAEKEQPGSVESRARWDAKAPSFAHKPTRSGYISQLLGLLDLQPGQTVFDMGCGSGTLSVPLAQAGHEVIAVDFSSGMLEELHRAAERAGVNGRIQTFQRSWQQDWSDLPAADVALSSRSFITESLGEGIAKLEGQAKSRVVLTCGAGDLPYRDSRVLEAMGRAEEATMPPSELAVMANYLWSRGRLPRISYIEYPGVWHRPTREALEEAVRIGHEPCNGEEEARLAAHLENHAVFDEEKGWWMLDYPRTDRWAVLDWQM